MTAALDYIRAGWALVPIPKGAKGPRGEGWNTRERCVTREADAGKLTANLGLAHAYSGTCVIDIDGMDGARKWLADRGVDLDAFYSAPDAVRISSGRPNRGKLLYRLPAGVAPLPQKKVANGDLDFRCGTTTGKTVQDVLPPSIHPDTGKPYVWEYGDDLIGDWRSPPELPAALLDVWRSIVSAQPVGAPDTDIDTLDALLMSEPKVGLSADDVRTHLAEHDPDAPYDSDVLAEGSWLKVGMALHHEFDGDAVGLDLWDEWSSAGSKYKNRADLETHWRSFGKGAQRVVTARWIIKVATVRKVPTPVLDSRDTMNCARELIARQYDTDQGRTLQHVEGLWYEHAGSHYVERSTDAVHSVMWKFLDGCRKYGKEDEIVPFKPSLTQVNGITAALRAEAYVQVEKPPAWLPGYKKPVGDIIALHNGLLHIQSRALLPHTPGFFTVNALPFDWNPNVAPPTYWLKFLNDLWGNDRASIESLQEMFGYLLTADTSQQKMFLIVGAKRSGKGTIGRVLNALIGADNIANPTLSSLTSNFGLQPLIGKLIAVVSDARLSAKSDSQSIVERLLMVSGEDNVTIDRKNLKAWTGKLSARFVLLTNELPHLGDSSGALASRFVILETTKSFYGREDLTLTSKLVSELPAIFKWALEGRERLAARGHFTQPESARATYEELDELNSPVSTFFVDRCELMKGEKAACMQVFDAWRDWCGLNGRDNHWSAANFARSLRAAYPQISTCREMRDGTRERFFIGVRIKQRVDDLLV